MRFLVLCLGFVFYSAFAKAQQDTFAVPLENLALPNSPAFVLLDEAPSVIERPATPKAFAIELLQNFDGNAFDNIAVEFAPFWLSKPKKLTYFDLKGLKPTADASGLENKGFNPLVNLVVSFAHVKNQDSITNISIGARTTLIEIKHAQDIARYAEGYKAVNDLFDLKKKIKDEFGNEDLERSQPQEYAEQFKVYYTKRLPELTAERPANAAAILETLDLKPIFALDVAAAYNKRFYNDNYEEGNGDSRYGFWATATTAIPIGRDYNNKNYLNAYGFVRYLKDEIGNTQFNALDMGLKAELQFNKLFIGYEYVNRSGDLDDFRSVGNIRYVLTKKIDLVGSFGNNFNDTNDLVSILGIRWGFDSKNQEVQVTQE